MGLTTITYSRTVFKNTKEFEQKRGKNIRLRSKKRVH